MLQTTKKLCCISSAVLLNFLLIMPSANAFEMMGGTGGTQFTLGSGETVIAQIKAAPTVCKGREGVPVVAVAAPPKCKGGGVHVTGPISKVRCPGRVSVISLVNKAEY